MKRSKTTLLSAAMLVGGISIAGCGSSTTVGPAAKTTSTPQHGGTIVYALPGQVQVNWYFPLMDNGSNSVYNGYAQSLLYKSLLTLHKNGSIDYQRSLVKSIKPNKAGTQYTVTLRSNFKWSNGHPVTAQDALFTYEIAKAASAKNAPAPWPYAGADFGGIPNNVNTVTANSKYQFTISLKKPVNQEWFIYNGIGGGAFTPLPKSIWNKHPKNMTKELTWLAKVATQPTATEYQVVDGPFKLSNAVPSQHWTFVPNAKYDGHKAYVSKLIFQYESSSTAEFSALKTGAVQAGYLPHALWGSRQALASKYNLSPVIPMGYNDVLLNMNVGHKNAANNAPNGVGSIFKHLYVRQALQMAINQSAINTAAFQGHAALGNGSVLAKPKTVFYDTHLKMQYPYNPSSAKQLLLKHGWKDVNGVMTNKAGQKLKFTMLYTSGSQAFTEEATIIQQGLKKIGVALTLRPEPFSTIIAKTNNQWQIEDYGGISYNGSYPSGGGLFGSPGVGLNSQGYYSKTMASLIHATHQPFASKSASLAALYKYEAYVSKHLPALWVPYPPLYLENAKTVHGVASSFNPFTQGISPNYWWVSK